MLVSAGFTETEALRAATLGPAEFLDAADSLGTVEAGKLADLVLLAANPLDDIANTQRIEAVVARGRLFDRAALDALLEEAASAALPRAEPNDHRQTAGRMVDGELHVELEAVEAAWYPRGDDGPRIVTPAFAEVGQPPLVPGPLLRPTVGTPVRVTVRNTLADTVEVVGLVDRATLRVERPEDASPEDPDFLFAAPLVVAPGETAEARFTPTAPVTSFYTGRVLRAEPFPFPAKDGSFAGALVVDGPEGPPPGERLLAIHVWGSPEEPSTLATSFKFMINGLSWPHTERLRYDVGEDVRWRILNMSGIAHPMHLHGFYFRVDGRGDTQRDTAYAEPPSAVTDLMPELSSLRLTWTPERPGNWLFHCHLIRHMGAGQRFAVEGARRPMDMDAASDPMVMDGMAGLVLGVQVDGEAPDDAPPVRTLHLWTAATPGVFGEYPALSFVVTDGDEPPRDTLRAVGSPLVLRQGEPTEIVVHNRYEFPVSVHWHGLEVRSLYDGVAHWSGQPGSTRPPVPARGTARVLITPPRAGTFMYHVHGELGHELSQGLHGAFLVLPEDASWDRARDRVFVLSARGAGLDAPPAINGALAPPPERFAPGEPVRVRFAHISADARKHVRLLRDGEPVAWRPVAKDGADLPASARAPVPARVTLGVGETLDVAWTPEHEGVYVLEVETEHYSASTLPNSLQRVAFGVGAVGDGALAEAAHVERPTVERDTTPGIELPEDLVERIVGRYASPRVPFDLTVARDAGGGLTLAIGVRPSGPLVPLSGTAFRFEDPVALRAGDPFPRVTIEVVEGRPTLVFFGMPFAQADE
ncbi:MAG: multicopper oxidase domain-containing protein [Gemmatimonadota bacterium]